MQDFSYNKKSTVFIMQFAITIVLFSLIIKYFDIQIIKHQKYVAKSRSNSIRQVIKKAPRGIIYDRNEIAIVDNRPIFELQIIPEDINSGFDYKLFESITQIDSNFIKNQLNAKIKSIYKFKPMTIKRHLDFIEMSRLKENLLQFPGILFSEIPARIYPDSCQLSHTLGYLREVNLDQINSNTKSVYRYGDIIGTDGIEKQYESSLRGLDGFEYHRVDKFGRDHGIIDDEIKYNKKSGAPLTLTIDSRLQFFAEKIMKNYKGALIAMNPVNGDVLSIVSTPQFDLTSFIGPIPYDTWSDWSNDISKPLNNRVLNGYYAPGSIFKIVTAAMILETDRIHPSKNYLCKGSYEYYDVNRHCWNLDGHGEVNLNDAIKYSCNIYFYKAIQEFKLSEWYEMAERFGFNSKTNIDLPNEFKGIVPDKKYMNDKYTSRGWARGNLLNFVIGQGEIITTPIQIVQFMNIISTRGNTKAPHLVLDLESEKIDVKLENETWDFIKKSLYDVVNSNGGTGVNTKLYSGGVVSGKTGTVENPPNEPHSWFAGYLETKDDILTIAVIVENGGKGSATATPIAKEYFKKYLELSETNSLSYDK